jgi:hypothetical protein
MSEGPFRGAFRHQHGDPQSLRERIDAQLRERIEEAVEMAGLETMVHARRSDGRPPPAEDNPRDRDEFNAMAERLLNHLHAAFQAALSPEQRRALLDLEAAAADPRAGRLAAQVYLAKQLPDYWQRFEACRADFTRAAAQGEPSRPGWLRRLFRS